MHTEYFIHYNQAFVSPYPVSIWIVCLRLVTLTILTILGLFWGCGLGRGEGLRRGVDLGDWEERVFGWVEGINLRAIYPTGSYPEISAPKLYIRVATSGGWASVAGLLIVSKIGLHVKWVQLTGSSPLERWILSFNACKSWVWEKVHP